MNICILTTSYPLNNNDYAGHFVRDPARLMAANGHCVTVVAPDHKGASPLNDKDVTLRRFKYFPVRSLQCVAYGSGILPNLKQSLLAKAQAPLFMLCFLSAALRAARNADIIHAHWSVSGLIGLYCKRFLHKPVVVHIHGSDLSAGGPAGLSRITGKVIRNADGVITVSQELYDAAKKISPGNSRIKLIRNGVDTEIFRPDKDRSFIGRELGTRTIDNVLLFSGRLTRVKGPDIALDCFKHILSVAPSSMLLLAGKGEMEKQLMATVDNDPTLKDHVVFLGVVPWHDMPELYNACDLLLITSRSEGTPSCLYEALSCGLPVAALPVGGVPEIMHSRPMGLLHANLNPDPKEFAGEICLLLQKRELMNEYSRNASDWAASNCRWQTVIEQYMNIYKSLVRTT